MLLRLRLLLRVHAGLRLLRGRLRLRLLLVHHVLLLRLEVLVLLLLLRMLSLLRLHVRVLGVHLVVHLGLDQRRAVRAVEHATLMIDRGRLELATRVDNRSGRMSVRGRRVPHVTHAGAGGRRPVAAHAVDAAVLLLVLIIGRVPHVHPIVGRKPRIRHILLAAGGPIVVPGDSLTEETGVARVRGLLGLLLNRLRLLGHLDGGTVVLLMLMRVFHPAITQVRDVRIREVRTHATVPPVRPADTTSVLLRALTLRPYVFPISIHLSTLRKTFARSFLRPVRSPCVLLFLCTCAFLPPYVPTCIFLYSLFTRMDTTGTRPYARISILFIHICNITSFVAIPRVSSIHSLSTRPRAHYSSHHHHESLAYH